MQAILEYVESQTKDRINMVGPSVSYLIQSLYDKRDIENQKKAINQKDYDWVIFPINDKDDPEKGDGGTHWSLIVYNKKDNTYLYFDPLNGRNIKYAKALHLNLIDDTSYEGIDSNGRTCHFVPPLVEVKCQGQANGYDCGIFIMAFMATIMKNIVEGKEIGDNKNGPYKTDELRDLLLAALNAEIDRRKNNLEKHNIIHVMEKLKETMREKANEERMRKEKEKENLEKALNSLGKKSDNIDNRDKKSGEEDNNGNKNDDWRSNNKGNDKRDERRSSEGRIRKKCWFFMNKTCRNGKNCSYEHPERERPNEWYDRKICELWSEMGSCSGVNGGCGKLHPRICSSFNDQVECYRRYCTQVHPRISKREKREIQSQYSDKTGYLNDGYRAALNGHRGTQSRYFENTGYHNDRYQTSYHGDRGIQRESFLHHQGTQPFKRKPFLQQGKNPYMEDRAYIAGEEIDLHRALVKEIVREEMENRGMRGTYPRGEVAFRVAEGGSRVGY